MLCSFHCITSSDMWETLISTGKQLCRLMLSEQSYSFISFYHIYVSLIIQLHFDLEKSKLGQGSRERSQRLLLNKAVKVLLGKVTVPFPLHGKILAFFTHPRLSPKHKRHVKTLALLMQARSYTNSLTFGYVFMHNFKWVILSYHLVSRLFIPHFVCLRSSSCSSECFWVLIGNEFPVHCFSFCVFVVVLRLSPFKDSSACQVLNALELRYITHNCK